MVDFIFSDKLAPLYGSIVIVCKNLEEISDLSEYLFQIGEDHLRLEHRSANDRTGKINEIAKENIELQDIKYFSNGSMDHFERI